MRLLLKANKSLLKLKSKTCFISLPQLGKPVGLNIIFSSDATSAGLEVESSLGCFIIFVWIRMNRITPICWPSKKLDWITKFPLASETLAFSEAADAGVLIAVMLQKIFKLPRLPEVLCKIDTVSLVETLKSSSLVSDQCLTVIGAWVKGMIVKKEIQSEWIRGLEQMIYSLKNEGAYSDILKDFLHK